MVEWSNGSSGKEGEEKWLSGTSFRVIRFFVLEFELQFDRKFFNFFKLFFQSRVFVFFNECSWHSINTLSKQSRQSSSSWYRLDGVECKFSVNTIISESLFCVVVIGKILTEISRMNFPLLHDESTVDSSLWKGDKKNCRLAWRSSSARTDKIATL